MHHSAREIHYPAVKFQCGISKWSRDNLALPHQQHAYDRTGYISCVTSTNTQYRCAGHSHPPKKHPISSHSAVLSNRVPELGIFDISQIVKRVQVVIDNHAIFVGLREVFGLVAADE